SCTPIITILNFLGDKFSGFSQSQEKHLRFLAATHLRTYPGDWQMGVSIKHSAILHRFLKNPKPNRQDMERVFRLIEFRDACTRFADVMVNIFQWPRPYELSCKKWNKMSVLRPLQEVRAGEIVSVMIEERFHLDIIPWTTEGVSFNFTRPTYYIASCLALTDMELDTICILPIPIKGWKALLSHADTNEWKELFPRADEKEKSKAL
ncbi:hypothetical protein V8F33_011460, partial [Rhypophila sp. PSN 637]